LKKDKRLDATLVKAYQLGNQEALTALVKRWHLRFCKKAYWLVKDADMSKDIAQDTWQTIINKIQTLQDPSNFGSWALRIVYNKSLDVMRLKAKHQKKMQVLDDKQTVNTEINKEKEDLREELLKAIKNLPSQQQIVIKLFYLEAYSIKKISKTLNISTGTAKSRLVLKT